MESAKTSEVKYEDINRLTLSQIVRLMPKPYYTNDKGDLIIEKRILIEQGDLKKHLFARRIWRYYGFNRYSPNEILRKRDVIPKELILPNDEIKEHLRLYNPDIENYISDVEIFILDESLTNRDYANIQIIETGRTTLMIAAEKGKYNNNILNTNFNIQDIEGNTAFHYVSNSSILDYIGYYIGNADFNIRNKEGKTPLVYLSSYHNIIPREILLAFIELGDAKIDIKDNGGNDITSYWHPKYFTKYLSKKLGKNIAQKEFSQIFLVEMADYSPEEAKQAIYEYSPELNF